MILQVADVISRFLAAGALGPRPSVVRVHTTRALYLVFASNATAPSYVVQFGSEKELRALHDTLGILSEQLPGVVPSSFVCAECDQAWVHIQSGMPGLPWFRLRDQLRSVEAWTRLRERALATLHQLHAVVESKSMWRTRFSPGEELRLQHARFLSDGALLSHQASDAIAQAEGELDRVRTLEWFSQHGDFCVNNLLVSSLGIAVIDFEEFGATSMPLHDEIGLAYSLADLTACLAGAPGLGSQIRACTEPTISNHPELGSCLQGLILHHLLWRINQCRDRPTRQQIRLRLINAIEKLVGGGPADTDSESEPWLLKKSIS